MPSPFSRIIALDYHDGPRAGLLECGTCGQAYRFERLDEWINHEDGDLRIFSLAALPPDAFPRLVTILKPYQAPRWPVWAPLWQFPTPAAETETDRQVQEILDSAAPPTLAIATSNLMGEILTAHDLTGLDLTHVDDWFTFLGIARSRAEV